MAVKRLKPGDMMKDGTIYAGLSPDTHQQLFVAPEDAPLVLTFKAAADYAKNLEIGGRRDFRLPTKGELEVIFSAHEEGKLKGTFNKASGRGAGTYWSSTQFTGDYQWCLTIKDPGGCYKPGDLGGYHITCAEDTFAIRAVRSGPAI